MNKIFVSYKYADKSVRGITGKSFPHDTVRDYVNVLERKIDSYDIYKGESDDNDLSQLTNESIWNTLKQKIYDSSITIVLISKNMKEYFKPEKDQWIPQEISYSLKEICHNGKASRTNALIYLVIPDENGSYDYFMPSVYFPNSGYKANVIFDIMKGNIGNKKYGAGDYAVIVKWDTFIHNYNYYIEMAKSRRDNISFYNVQKTI